MLTSNPGSPEQLLREISGSAVKRINLGIAQLKNSSEPIYILPPLVKLPSTTFEIGNKSIPLKRPTADTPVVRIAFHPVFQFAADLGCLPPLMKLPLDFPCLTSNKPRFGWITSDSITLIQLLQPVWLAELRKGHYTLVHGYRTYGTLLSQNADTLFATVWNSPTKKHTQSGWYSFLEFATLPAIIDILTTSLNSQLFNEKIRARLIFWLDTLGVLPLLFENGSRGSSKRAALAAADLPESTYNLHTRDLRKRQLPLPCQPTPSSPDDHKQGLGEEVAPTTLGADSGGPAMTPTDDTARTDLPPEEEEKESSDDGPKYGTPPL